MDALDLSIYAMHKDRQKADEDYTQALEEYSESLEIEVKSLYKKIKKVKRKNKALKENIEDALVYINTSDTIIDADKEKLSLILQR